VDADTLFAAARSGDAAAIATALDRDPQLRDVRDQPFEWTLLHHAAQRGHLPIVNLLLERGFDVNTKEKGDHTTALNWAAAAGHVDVVRRLLDAGVDAIGLGDDHELEVIGWATCWDGCDDQAHHSIADQLVERGARHHIFSAISMNRGDEVRRIVAGDRTQLERKMSQFEDFRLPLHFAVQRNRPEMVRLLLELGADPHGKDGSGCPPAAYAMQPGADRALHEALKNSGDLDLFTALALGEEAVAAEIIRSDPQSVERGGILHLMSKRGHAGAVKWLLSHGAGPNTLWAHWDANVTPLHLAVLGDHLEVVRVLLAAGADPSIRDSKHDSDAIGWAQFFERPAIVSMLTAS